MGKIRSMEKAARRKTLKELKPADIEKLISAANKEQYSRERADRYMREMIKMRTAIEKLKEYYDAIIHGCVVRLLETNDEVVLPRKADGVNSLDEFDIIIHDDFVGIKRKVIEDGAAAIAPIGDESEAAVGEAGASGADPVVPVEPEPVSGVENVIPYPKRRKPKQSGSGESEARGS